MDILLEILSHSTNLAKEVVRQVFKMTMEHMTKESLDILTKVSVEAVLLLIYISKLSRVVWIGLV